MQNHTTRDDLTPRSDEHIEIQLFSGKHGVSCHCSPETLVTGETLNHEKDCLCGFGECAQAHAHTELQNGMQERVCDTIHLRPNDNAQGGHLVMDLTIR